MDYKKIYDDLISKARSENRIKGGDIYYEAHHIIPKCMGGEGTVKQWKTHHNIILLTAKEHFVVHKLLCEIYPNNKKLRNAYWNFVNGRNNKNNNITYNITSREYERIKITISKILSNKMSMKKEEFINRCLKIYGDKYDYSQIEYINSNTKVKIICKIHGEFEKSPKHHINNRGCNICGLEKSRSVLFGRVLPKETYKRIGDKKRSNINDFILKAKNIHKDKYDYSQVEYINAKTKVKINCKIHAEFEQRPNHHLRGQGCPKCYGNKKII